MSHMALSVDFVPNMAGVSIVCLLGHRRIQNISRRTGGVCWLCERIEGL